MGKETERSRLKVTKTIDRLQSSRSPISPQTYREEQERAAEKTRRLDDRLSVGDAGLRVRVPSAPPSPEEKRKIAPPKTTSTTTDDAGGAAASGASPVAVVVETPTAPTATTTFLKLHEQTECVICMDSAPDVIFLPCGHVCACRACAEPLAECPLCRQDIAAKLVVGAGKRVAA